MSGYGKGPKVPLAICHLWFYVFYTRSLVCLESGCEACIYPALVDYFPQMVTPTVNTFNWIIYLFPIDSKCYFYHETNFHYLFYFWTFLECSAAFSWIHTVCSVSTAVTDMESIRQMSGLGGREGDRALGGWGCPGPGAGYIGVQSSHAGRLVCTVPLIIGLFPPQ